MSDVAKTSLRSLFIFIYVSISGSFDQSRFRPASTSDARWSSGAWWMTPITVRTAGPRRWCSRGRSWISSLRGCDKWEENKRDDS